MNEIELTADDVRCPVHQITDCSPLLNGCSIPNIIASRIRRKVEQEVKREQDRVMLTMSAVLRGDIQIGKPVGCVCGRIRPCGGPHDCAMM